jgi:hypothetical protein
MEHVGNYVLQVDGTEDDYPMSKRGIRENEATAAGNLLDHDRMGGAGLGGIGYPMEPIGRKSPSGSWDPKPRINATAREARSKA